MFLDSLPNEVLRIVFQRLTPTENFLLRQTSRRFWFLIDASYMLTLDPNCVQVDFGNQVLILHHLNTIKQIAVVNGNVAANEYQEDHGRRTNYLQHKEFQVFCDVGHNWSKSMQKYLKKLKEKQFAHRIFCTLGVILPLDGSVPDELLQLTISFNEIIIQTLYHCFGVWEQLPEVLDKWLSKGNVKHSLRVFYKFSVSQIDRLLNTPCVDCLLDNEGAVYLLDKYLNQNLPQALEAWYFDVEPKAIGFLEALKDNFGLQRESIVGLCEGAPFVHYRGSHKLQLSLNTVNKAIEMILKKS